VALRITAHNRFLPRTVNSLAINTVRAAPLTVSNGSSTVPP
jgi:hypothetical protein